MNIQQIKDDLAKIEDVAESVHPGAKAEIEGTVARIRAEIHKYASIVETDAQKVIDATEPGQ